MFTIRRERLILMANIYAFSEPVPKLIQRTKWRYGQGRCFVRANRFAVVGLYPYLSNRFAVPT